MPSVSMGEIVDESPGRNFEQISIAFHVNSGETTRFVISNVTIK